MKVFDHQYCARLYYSCCFIFIYQVFDNNIYLNYRIEQFCCYYLVVSFMLIYIYIVVWSLITRFILTIESNSIVIKFQIYPCLMLQFQNISNSSKSMRLRGDVCACFLSQSKYQQAGVIQFSTKEKERGGKQFPYKAL